MEINSNNTITSNNTDLTVKYIEPTFGPHIYEDTTSTITVSSSYTTELQNLYGVLIQLLNRMKNKEKQEYINEAIMEMFD